MYLYPNLGETAFSIWPVRKMTVPANKGPVGWNTKPFEEKKNEKKSGSTLCYDQIHSNFIFKWANFVIHSEKFRD